MDYLIYQCRGALDLMKRFSRSHGAYLPIEQVRKFDTRDPKKTWIVEYALMPGLIFVPRRHGPDFVRRCSERDYVRAVHVQAPNPKHNPRVRWRQATTTIDVLRNMQEQLNREFADREHRYRGTKPARQPDTPAAEASDGPLLHVGQRVRVPTLNGVYGTVERVKSCGRVRLRLEKGAPFAEIPKNLLVPA